LYAEFAPVSVIGASSAAASNSEDSPGELKYHYCNFEDILVIYFNVYYIVRSKF
jgi:hypothetical protein